MKTGSVFIMAVVLCAAGFAVEGQVSDRHVYVAVNGSDTNPGTELRPVATLEKARDLLRLRPAGDGSSVVHVRAGNYQLTSTLKLDKRDSGSKGRPVIYRAEGTVRLVGGRVIPASAFRQVSDPAVTARFPALARSHVVALDLNALGIKHAGPFPELFRDGGGIIELFVDGKRLPLARWPNDGYTTIKRVTDSGKWSGPNPRGGTFQYRDKRAGQWQKAVSDGLWLKGFWRVPWTPETVRVASIDAKAGTITQAKEVGGGLGSKYSKSVGGQRAGNGKEKWYALNLLEELDRPGEWCLHFPTKTLYLWPPTDLSKAAILISDLKEPLVAFDNASHVTFRGFILEGGLGNGVEVEGGAGIVVAGCEILNLAGTGVVVNGGRGHSVVSCDLHHLGQGGIYVGGGDRKTLTSGGHQILNNHIYRVGQLQTTYAPAIMVGAYRNSDPAGRSFKAAAVGCRMAHNLIHDLPHAAVLYSGNDNVFEYNEVWRVAQDSGDVGGFYTWHDWTSRGNILRYNLVADSPSCNAFYMDDGDSGDTVTGNVIWRTQCGPFIGGGHDNIVTGNLVIDCERGLHLDDRGRNRGYNQKNMYLMGRLNEVAYTKPPWSERYPEMMDLLKHPDLPTGNRLIGNVLVGCKTPLQLSGNKMDCTIMDNKTLSRRDIGLPAKGNPIPALRGTDEMTIPQFPGFKPIPMAKIGLYKDSFRHALPRDSSGAVSADSDVFDTDTDIQRSNQK